MKQASAYFLSAVFLVGVFLASTMYRQDIEDWWFLRSYSPSMEVSSLAATSFMSDEGQRIFYLSDPEVEDAADFQQDCEQREQSLVLGCFSQSKIYIFNVDDPRLDGVKEVTSAHEMLHAVYQRMSMDEKTELNKMLEAQLAKIDNKRVLDLVQLYEDQADGTPQYNEMHSIFGTELRSLDADLERHYSSYFSNRAGLVSIAEEYEAVFTQLRDEADGLLANIQTLKSSIDSINTQLINQKSTIDEGQAGLDGLRTAVELSQSNSESADLLRAKINAFNSALFVVQANIDTYNSLVGELNSAVAGHNNAVKEYNLIIGEQNELVEQLDSSVEEL